MSIFVHFNVDIYIYARKDEEGNEEIIKKSMPAAVIPGSFVTSSILASIIDKKFT